MQSDFRLFGTAHVAILAAIPAAAYLLSRLVRRYRRTCLILGIALIANEIVWWTWRIAHEGSRFPEGLPLHFCDFGLWLSVAALLTLRPVLVELAYFFGLAGSSMAVLTPELWAPLASYPSIYFFLSHGGVVAVALVLTWSGILQLKAGAVQRAFLALNAWALAVGAFNLVFGTNYMYLRRKPTSASPLDWFGPWPAYILAGEIVALALLWLLAKAAGQAVPRPLLNFPFVPTDPNDREYFRFHRKRLAFLLETIRQVLPRGDGVRLLDVGRTPVTDLIRAAFPGLTVHTLGFGGTPAPGHSPWNLNDAQHRQCWPKIGPYDVIVMAEVIEHLYTAPTLVLASMASLLAPSGVLILQTPNAVSLAKRIRLFRGENPFEMIRETPENPGHFREYTLDELRGVAAAAGLRVSMVVRRNYFDPPGWRNRLYHRICDFMPERLREGITVCLVHRPSPR